MTRKELIEQYHKYSPNDCYDLIDVNELDKRLNDITLEELQIEVNFFINTSGWD